MMRFICKKCDEPCIISVEDDSESPVLCPFGYDVRKAEWEEIESPGKLIWYGESCLKDDGERQAATPEPAPTGNGQYVLSEVIKDLCARADEGQKKYGTMLRTENGRNALNDLYQELADALMYLKQYMLEDG